MRNGQVHESRLTLSFYKEEFRGVLQFCGTKSVREVDKVKETWLKPVALESGAMTFEQARLTLDCRKLFKSSRSKGCFCLRYRAELVKHATEIRYRIKDCCTHFYLKQVLSERERIEKGLYESVSLAHTEGWDARMVRQFETLVLSAAPYLKRGRKGEGCQIDLLIPARKLLGL